MRNLADGRLPRDLNPAVISTAEVVAVDSVEALVSVRFGGDLEAVVDEVPYLAGYKPTVGDLVTVLRDRWTLLVLGSSGPAASSSGGVTDHGALTGLGDNDHPQYVHDTGDKMTGNLEIEKSSPTLFLDDASATTDGGRVEFQRAGVSKWKVRSGSGADSDALEFNRVVGGSTEQVVLRFDTVEEWARFFRTSVLEVRNDQAPQKAGWFSAASFGDFDSGIYFRNAAWASPVRWTIYKSGVAETGGNSGSNLIIKRWDDYGVATTAFTINRDTGLIRAYSHISGGPVVPLHDTDWCVVDPANGWTASSIRIRRFGNQVTLRVNGLSPASRTSPVFAYIPVGFRWDLAARGNLATAQSAGALVRQVNDYDATRIQMSTATTGDSSFSGMVHWFTAEDWPTSLPASARYLPEGTQ